MDKASGAGFNSVSGSIFPSSWLAMACVACVACVACCVACVACLLACHGLRLAIGLPWLAIACGRLRRLPASPACWLAMACDRLRRFLRRLLRRSLCQTGLRRLRLRSAVKILPCDFRSQILILGDRPSWTDPVFLRFRKELATF